MTNDEDNELDNRIAARAFQIWIDEGQPYGRHSEHWELAKLAIAQEDGMGALRKSASHPAGSIETANGQPLPGYTGKKR